MLMSKDKIIKFEFLCILFLICFYNIDKIENAVHVLVKLFRLLKEFILKEELCNLLYEVISIDSVI